ncbi:protein FAM131C [Genypterus blacodes]|uniref:protein FAM131C n=1 Tax=Genypterus blacodes TaxID=154954 RepID=UPI003F76B746
MGACLCKGHKEFHHPMTAFQSQCEEGQASTVKDGQDPSSGSTTEKSSRYDIGELATSSLIGLVATIKEHITKPTAMAQGRVAHLIEWKGWGGGGATLAGGGGWRSGAGSKGGGGWAGMGAELQEDEKFYSQMTDEIKEARFAAGVAEQFALAEAAMNVWCMNDSFEQPSTSLQAQSHFLSQFLLDGGSVGVPQHLYSIHTQTCDSDRATNLIPPTKTAPVCPATHARQDGACGLETGSTVIAEAAVRHIDSSSLSEDDVFYN